MDVTYRVVWRSADPDAEQLANEAFDYLIGNSIRSRLMTPRDPGMPPGAYALEVTPEEAPTAEALLARWQAERSSPADPSASLDLVPVFEGTGTTAEMEATEVQRLLDANGITAVMVGTPTIPTLPFEVRVARERLEDAQRILKEAQETGPSAAEEATS
jgi:hypothetical protein